MLQEKPEDGSQRQLLGTCREGTVVDKRTARCSPGKFKIKREKNRI